MPTMTKLRHIRSTLKNYTTTNALAVFPEKENFENKMKLFKSIDKVDCNNFSTELF